jgi:hypothetical protein
LGISGDWSAGEECRRRAEISDSTKDGMRRDTYTLSASTAAEMYLSILEAG